MLNARDIIAAAEERAGISDPETHLHAHLERLVDSLNEEARLPEWGEGFARRALEDRTVSRLEGLRWVDDYPDITDEVIDRPVFLTGLPRSGTTFFQYLFDNDERFRLIRTWEGIEPSPPPGFDPDSVTRRKADEAERRRRNRPEVEGFEAMHLVDADGPEECHAIMEHSYAAAGFYNLFDVPAYFDYLLNELDFETAYRTHKRQLQLFQWRCPQPRWALKYPNHLLAMDTILSIHPEARFVMTHRDPVQTLASICKLTFTLRSALYDAPVDRARVGRQLFEFVAQHIDRIMAFANSPQAERVTHADYYRLVDNPAVAMRDIHGSLGIDTPEPVAEAVADWHRRNPKDARGVNQYALEDYGLNEGEVAERFAPYMQHFDIPREQDGLRRRKE